MFSKLVKHISYPLIMAYDGNSRILKFIDKYRDLENKTISEIEAEQFHNLKNILCHAGRYSKYYNDLFKSNCFDPETITSVDDIRAIPVLSKKLITNNFDEIKCTGIPEDKIRVASTGGSTGTPLKILRDLDCIYLRKAQELYFDKKYMNYDIGDKIGYFVSASHTTDNLHALKAKMRNALCERMLVFSPYDINGAYLEDYTNKFFKYRPRIVKCFPNSLVIFAKYLFDRDITIDWVTSISCTGETLHNSHKHLFRSVFVNSKIIEKYAAIECGVMACGCCDDSVLHIFSPGVYVELLDNENNPVTPGMQGKIVITDLYNKALPLIRYEIGDMAIQDDNSGKCCCDSNLPKLNKILGRDRDILFDENSDPRPGYLFVNIINKLGFTGQFQILQKANSNVIIRVAKQKLEKSQIDRILRDFDGQLGSGIKIDIVEVDHIEREKSGKYTYVKNERSFFQS